MNDKQKLHLKFIKYDLIIIISLLKLKHNILSKVVTSTYIFNITIDILMILLKKYFSRKKTICDIFQL